MDRFEDVQYVDYEMGTIYQSVQLLYLKPETELYGLTHTSEVILANDLLLSIYRF
jgi:hypothetical protein